MKRFKFITVVLFIAVLCFSVGFGTLAVFADAQEEGGTIVSAMP